MIKRMINRSNDPYVFDTDENEMIALTEKNVRFVSAILSIDSTYKSAETGLSGSAQELFQKHGITTEKELLTLQVKALNKENSTHLYVADGLNLTVERIMSISNLKERLIKRDETIVKEIASAVPGRNNFSFATKFCTFACRYSLDKPYDDGYCIYDTVLEQTIPYYAWRFLGEKFIRRKQSTLRQVIAEKRDYKRYIDLIDRIINASAEETDYKISHKDFDHLLWYCYKGDAKRRVSMIAEKINS